MYKRITLAIAIVVVVTGALSLIAQERDADRPRESALRDPDRAAERQPVMRERAERGDIEPGRRERARLGDQPRQEPTIRIEGRRQPTPPMAPAAIGPIQEEFGKWLDELTKAYRANDREKMGEIIRQMHQLRRQRQARGKVSAEPPRDYLQVPKKVGKLQPGAEKKAPKPAEKTPQPAKKLAQTWQGWQGQFPGGPPGWAGCPWRGWGPRWRAMAGRGMAFQGRGLGWRGQAVRPPALKDTPAGPARPRDVPAPMSPERPRGFGWWRQQGSPPRFMDRPDAPVLRDDVVRPTPPQPGRGMGRRGWGPMSPMAPEGPPEPAAPRPD